MAIIELSSALVDQCKRCAQQRDHNRRHSFDYSSDKTDDKGIWSFMGVLGEVALLTYFEFEIDWEYLSTDKGFCGVDVGDIWEVRAMSKFGNRLFLWSDEVTKPNKLSYAWSKVVVDPSTGYCNVCGWAMGYEIAARGVHDQYDCKRSSYFYPNDQLRQHRSPLADQVLSRQLHTVYKNIEHESIF